MADDLDEMIARLERQLIDEATRSHDFERAANAAKGRLETASPMAKDLSKLLNEFAGSLGPIISDQIAKSVLPLAKAVREIEGNGFKYMGVYQPAIDYRRGNVVTCDGGMWVALKNSAGQKPGSSDAWQLSVKSGSGR